MELKLKYKLLPFFFKVLLVYKGKGFCGGVIYKPTWILTASHCMENIDTQFLTVVAGTNPPVHSKLSVSGPWLKEYSLQPTAGF